MNKVEVTTRKSKLFAEIKQSLDAKFIQVQRHILNKLLQFPANPDEQKFLIEYLMHLKFTNLNNLNSSFYLPQMEKILGNQVMFLIFLLFMGISSIFRNSPARI